MAENSKIEWTDATFNCWLGCTKISPACDHCYAESWAKRAGNPELWQGERRRTTEANWRKPLKWNRDADKFFAEHGRRQRVFCASLADVFDNAVPPQWRTDLFRLIHDTPELDWLLLTKRIGNVPTMLGVLGDDAMPPNLWLGATVVNQEECDRDIQKLLAAPAAVRFLSMEPLLGPVNFRWTSYAHEASGETYREYFERNGSVSEYEALRKLDWVIVGGESGPHARRMDIEWVESIANQCREAGVPFFMKQGSQANWTEFKNFDEFHESIKIREFPISN
jgi:protein gp37